MFIIYSTICLFYIVNQQYVYLLHITIDLISYRCFTLDSDMKTDHVHCIQSHYDFLMENIDVYSLLPYLQSHDVISSVEMKEVVSGETPHPVQQVRRLLSLISLKSAHEFELFLTALDLTGQIHVSSVLVERATIGMFLLHTLYNVYP